MTRSRGLVLVVSALPLALCAAWVSAGQEKPLAQIASLQSQAIEAYRAKHYVEAIPLYRQLVVQTPNNPDILQDLMWTLWYAEHFEEAEPVAARLSKLHPDDAAVWAMLGRLGYMLGHREEALDALQKSYSLDPTQTNLLLDIGRAHMTLRHYKSAIQVLSDLRQKEPDLIATLPDLAKAQFLEQLFAESAKTWAQAVRAFPDKMEYQFQEAQALYFSGKQARAISEMEHLLEKNPHLTLALNFLVDTALARGDAAAAQAILERYLTEPTPADEPRFLRLAAIYQTANDIQGCVRTLDRLLAGNPRNGQALLMQADCLKDQGNFGDAETLYHRVLQNNPWSFRALKSLADLQNSLGHWDAALKYIRQARAMDPTDPYMRLQEANYIYAKGEKVQGEAMLRELLTANPGPNLSILLYHGLTPFADDPMLAYPIHYSVSTFDDHMRALKQAGFHPVTAELVQAWLQGKATLPSRPLLITFDDARLDSFRYGDPVLQKYGMNATMMVALANVERNLPGFASWSQLKAYQRTGRWEMQAHGNLGHMKIPMDEEGHVGLYMPTKRWLEKENRLETTEEWETRITKDMEQTSQALQTHLSVNAVAFAFPEGDYGQDNIYNFSEGPTRILKDSRALYGSLYHQDSYGYNVRTRDPSFLCRIEANPKWKGRDLVRQLTDRDPMIIAKRTLLRQALWEGRTHEANQWLAQLREAGVSPAVLFADEARIRSAIGDRPGAWDLAVRALAVDPTDKENQYLVQSLQEDKHLAWEPRLEFFKDNHNRENWMFHQQLETLRTGLMHWSMNQFHGSFRETGFPNITDDGGGLGLTRILGLYNTVSAQVDAHILSNPGQNTYSLQGGLHSRWTDHFESDFQLLREPYPTDSAMAAHITQQTLDLRTAWAQDGPWKTLTDVRASKISDDNHRYGGYFEIARLIDRLPEGVSGVFRFTADQTNNVSPNYYSPQQLQQYQAGLAYEAPWGGQAMKLNLRYLPGYGTEKASRGDFIQVADVDLSVNWGKSFSLRPSFSFTSTPSYHSTSYSLAFVSLF